MTKAQEISELACEIEYCMKEGVDLNLSSKGWKTVIEALRLAAQADATGAPSDRQFSADLRDAELPQSPPEPISFMQAMDIIERGFVTWKSKPHNKKWFKLIDGTPIPNDLAVNIAEAFCSAHTRPDRKCK